MSTQNPPESDECFRNYEQCGSVQCGSVQCGKGTCFQCVRRFDCYRATHSKPGACSKISWPILWVNYYNRKGIERLNRP